MRRLAVLVGLMVAMPLAAAAQQESLAEAARKAREKKKDQPKATKVFTNDTLPTGPGTVSVVGAAPPEPVREGEGKEAVKGEAKPAPEQEADEKGERYWRGRFAEARKNLGQAEKELELLQRELRLLEVQYYSDPNVALRESLTRADVNLHRKKIADKQVEVQRLRQQLSDLEDDLRRAGGSPAWARE